MVSKPQQMEVDMHNKLFSFSECGQYDEFIYVFYDVSLKVGVGNYKAGKKFPLAAINYDAGMLLLAENLDNEEYSIFELLPVVGKELR